MRFTSLSIIFYSSICLKVSNTVINQHDHKISWGENDLFGLYIYIAVHC